MIFKKPPPIDLPDYQKWERFSYWRFTDWKFYMRGQIDYLNEQFEQSEYAGNPFDRVSNRKMIYLSMHYAFGPYHVYWKSK